MTFQDLMKPETMELIVEQATADSIAHFDDFFAAMLDKVAACFPVPPPPGVISMTKLYITMGFEAGASNGAYKAVELLMHEIVKSITEHRK